MEQYTTRVYLSHHGSHSASRKIPKLTKVSAFAGDSIPENESQMYNKSLVTDEQDTRVDTSAEVDRQRNESAKRTNSHSSECQFKKRTLSNGLHDSSTSDECDYDACADDEREHPNEDQGVHRMDHDETRGAIKDDQPDKRKDGQLEIVNRDELLPPSISEEDTSFDEPRSIELEDELPGSKPSEDLQKSDFVLDPDGDGSYYWMGVVTLAVIYNYWVVILRIAFSEMRDEVTDPLKLSTNYRNKPEFRRDVLSILPLGSVIQIIASIINSDVLEAYVGDDKLPIHASRLPRLLKLHTMSKFFQNTDSRTNNPNAVRAFKLSLYLGVVIHWIGCFYYIASEYEGFGSNDWVYPADKGHQNFLSKYIRSFYWSLVTLTTIGGSANPVTNLEYIFTGITFLIGVFVFAAVVGNVGDVISNMNAARAEFQSRMDAIKFYMNHRKVPEYLQKRVKKWSDYSWHRTQMIDESSLLEMLPERLRAEIAIHVHLETLKKVRIFEDCEQGLLCELVLKLRSQIYSPGDYICRSGEIGREMYIINHGKVQVVVQDPQTGMKMVVATLSEGNYFGEISLLKLDEGQNRRTADVVSLGYSELLCLSKKDLMQALVEYPDAKKVLEKHGRDRMEKNKEAARLQRRKSEALLQIPGYLKSQDERKDTAHQDTAQSKTEVTTHGQKTTIQERGKEIGKEMSELRHIIHELRTFDSQATKHKVEQLAEKCNVLTDLLHKRDSELRRALSRISELEQRVIGKMKNGKVCPAKSYELHNGDYPMVTEVGTVVPMESAVMNLHRFITGCTVCRRQGVHEDLTAKNVQSL
uniref:cGMP-gated cation channel alpha-1-like n=1 Tax=Saccoglossus kowalevskii TaxID=10224 RepID=A0ABM0MX67_SACKO|nr:PREDICTED: cGMP-gated cation channel alpha-1-like [Saccoglossus kowalevskii]